MGTDRTPWHLGRLTSEAIGLREAVARVECLDEWEVRKRLSCGPTASLFRTVCAWRVHDPGHYLTLAKLLGHRKATHVASVACARPASSRRSP